MPSNTKKARLPIVNKTVQGAWHIAGGGKLPELHHDIASWLLTQVGETVSMLLALFKEGFKFEMREDEKKSLIYADIIVPARPDKFDRLMELTKGNTRAEKLKFHNTYNIWWVGLEQNNPNKVYINIRLFESEYVNEDGKEPKLKHIQTSANFLQAALTTYLDFNWKRIPDMVKAPALKQAAEQLMSNVGLVRDGEIPSFPSVEERDPEGRAIEWQEAVRDMTRRTTPFEYATAHEYDPRKFDEDDPRGKRLVNVSEDWARFSSSPFPRRMSLKLTPETSVVYRRIWKDDAGQTQNRLYIAVPVFKGLADDDKNRQKLSHEKLWWWHSRLSEFTPMPLWQKTMKKNAWLKPNRDTILIALEYDLQKDGSSSFEKTLCDSRPMVDDRSAWEICLSTLCERRARSGARSFDGNTLHHFPTYFRSDLSVGFDLKDTGIPERILALHFSDSPVITWVLGDIKGSEGRILETGSIEGNQILDEALAAQVRLEDEAGKLRWTGGKQFRGVLRNRTNELSNFIVNLAIEKGAHIALEKINWVNKRGKNAEANRRFSMWNYSALGKRIEWLGNEIQQRRQDGASAPICAYVNDYVIRAIYKKRDTTDIPMDHSVGAYIVFDEAVKRVVALAEKREKSG